MLGSKCDITGISCFPIFTGMTNVCYSTVFRFDFSLPKINKVDIFLTDDSKKERKIFFSFSDL